MFDSTLVAEKAAMDWAAEMLVVDRNLGGGMKRTIAVTVFTTSEVEWRSILEKFLRR